MEGLSVEIISRDGPCQNYPCICNGYTIIFVRVKLNRVLPCQKQHSTERRLFLNLRKKLVKSYIWSVAFCGAETWTAES